MSAEDGVPTGKWYVLEGDDAAQERSLFDDELTARTYLLLVREAFGLRAGVNLFLGRARGRPPVANKASHMVACRMTPELAAKLTRLGGATWLRDCIDKAKEPA